METRSRARRIPRVRARVPRAVRRRTRGFASGGSVVDGPTSGRCQLNRQRERRGQGDARQTRRRRRRRF